MLSGGSGDDLIDGGDGFDTLDASAAPAGVSIHLASAQAGIGGSGLGPA